MNIFFYINNISSGGAERVLSNLATEMANRGHSCTLITTFRTSWEYDLGENVKRLSLYEQRPKDFYTRNIQTIKRLRKYLTDGKSDVLVTFMGEPNFRGIIATLFTKIKIIVSVRSDPRYEYSSKLSAFLAKNLYRLANLIIFQTEDASKWFPKLIQRKSKIIFNPVNKSFYNVERKVNREGIVTAGRLVKEKNHRLLIESYALISSNILDDLYIYGSGDTTHLLDLTKSLGISDRVHFMGQCSDMSSMLSSSRLFVLSSDVEGMPNALMEAMAVGIPCISTDCPCGGPKALFPKSIKDYLVPVGDTNALAEKMKVILTDNEAETFLAAECQNASLLFESSIVYDMWEQTIKSVCK